MPREEALAICNADFCFYGFVWFLLELGSGLPKNEKCITIYNFHAGR